MKLNKRIKIIGTFIFVLALIIGVYLFVKSGQSDIELRKITITQNAMTVTIQTTGTVEPMNKVDILPPISGRIEKILVAEGDLVIKGQTIAWMSSTNRAALLDLAQTNRPSELKKWQDMYQPTPITVPVDGLIIKKVVVPGQTVSQQSILFEVSDQLIVRAQVDETDIGKITKNMEAIVIVDAVPNKPFESRVGLISHKSELINNVNIYPVELIPTQIPDECRSGMTAIVDFVVVRKPAALTIPLWAVQGAERIEVQVFDIDKNPKKLKLGLSNGKFVEVVSGGADGETIFIPGKKFKLKEMDTTPFSPWQRGRKKEQSK